jgi:AraC-like DNA-binding protein
MRVISRPAVFPNALATLSVSGTISTIGCVKLPPNLAAHDQLTDCVMGFAAGVLRGLCGPRWRPRGFHFAHGPPPEPSRYTAVLQAPISFDAIVTTMEFESTWLAHDYASPQDRASPDALAAMGWRRLRRDFAAEVRAILMSWNAVDRPSAPAVAAILGLQPRTLNRLLGRTGTSFNHVLADAQYETARRMLRDPTMSILSVAWSLGYADASAFSRAFHRWSGMTPTEWRKEAERSGL